MDFPLPPMGEGLYEVELVRWLVKPGEAVRRGQALLEVLSDKATMEVPAPFAGTITATLGQLGAKIAIGQVVLNYEPLASENPSTTPIAIAPTVAPLAATDTARSLAPVAAPSVRHIARQFGIDLAQLVLVDGCRIGRASGRVELTQERAHQNAEDASRQTPEDDPKQHRGSQTSTAIQ